MSKRYQITQARWNKIEGLLPGKVGNRGRKAKENRAFVNGVSWVLRSGAYWSHMSERYGKWKSTHKRFTHWARAGMWEEVFEILTQDAHNDYLMIDTTIVRAHKQAATRREGPKRGFFWGVVEEV